MDGTNVDFNKYVAWLEQQTWVLEDDGSLVFVDCEQGPRTFLERETEPGHWSEFHDDRADTDDVTEIHDAKLIAVLNAKKAELRTH